MNVEEITREYTEKGYALGGKLLEDRDIEELREELDRVIRDRDREDAGQPVILRNFAKEEGKMIWQIVDIWKASDAFRKLVFNAELARTAAALAGANELRIWHDQIQYKPASTGGVNMWHQDSPAWQVLQPKDAQVTAWIALDDVDEENGCMSMVAETHRLGVRRDLLREIDSFDGLPEILDGVGLDPELRPVERGHVHFHHPLTWHGSHGNSSGRPRRAIAVHYMTERTTYDESGEHVMKEYINVNDGEKVSGDYFPLVWRREA